MLSGSTTSHSKLILTLLVYVSVGLFCISFLLRSTRTTSQYKDNIIKLRSNDTESPQVSEVSVNSVESSESSSLQFPSPSLLAPDDESQSKVYELPEVSIQPPYYNFSRIVQDSNLSKVFIPHFENDYDWCQPAIGRQENFSQQEGKDGVTGIIYNKMPKTASSTIAGVTMRIASKCLSKKTSNETSASESFFFASHISNPNSPHAKKEQIYMRQRNVKRSFLFSSIRDPVNRSMSRVFFHMVTRHGKAPTDDNVLKYLTTENDFQLGIRSNGKGGFQLRYMNLYSADDNSAWKMNDSEKVLNHEWVIKTVQTVMDDYDFIILLERLDECLVLMQLILGVDINDILYLSAKVSGGYFKWNGKCSKIASSFVSPKVAEYVSSKSWYTEAFGDYLLIEALNQSIDRTIDEFIGKERFEDALEKFQTMKKMAENKCASRAIFPCSDSGEIQRESHNDCYKADEGCGYKCLDSLPEF